MKIQLTIIICVALLSVGLAFVKISQNQHQSNDQSQNTVVNTITKTVIINVPRGKKYKNVKWELKKLDGIDEAFDFFNNELNEWQRETAKMPGSFGNVIIYRTFNVDPIVFTNKRVITNNSKTMVTNTSEISNPILKIIKGFFK